MRVVVPFPLSCRWTSGAAFAAEWRKKRMAMMGRGNMAGWLVQRGPGLRILGREFLNLRRFKG